ncbi:uncharacterized protein LOC128642867 [Bombina bombina]|uniref:uncharacterized protein LOC128642867 n=1 Tax=Bombina bombina TaxID=8345 RepID=UPI00235B19A1|nr:uncharacterized protein LOC128642867 [Bombina bombina]XP_053551702.1 uncharacterized protein LOC128642867 [Bombina bombina]XP_053551703.1 uncharacterized protein LOC128642867 [Bombina bombina]XP_053551704.1 uncharacterized protein LOC128642867 [Bombina bombina]XP_053551705.1 uncharacterized protein LOC128642867 [Bombina bombina]XP_053551706.1 uncharacterized protein LOC128642867 [Bombina bombina]
MAHSRQCTAIPSHNPNKVLTIQEQTYYHDTAASVWEDSDFWPSVSLAGLLSLIFVLVAHVLVLAGGAPLIPFTGHGPSINSSHIHFQTLLPSQPAATWRALGMSLQLSELVEQTPITTVIAVAKEDASRTLICFSSSLMSLLTQQHQAQNLTKKLLHDETLKISISSSIARSSTAFYIMVVTQRNEQLPYGLILGPQHSVNRDEPLWKMTLSFPEIKNIVSMDREASAIATEILQNLYKSERIPQTYIKKGTAGHSIPVLLIQADPYLENGFVC